MEEYWKSISKVERKEPRYDYFVGKERKERPPRMRSLGWDLNSLGVDLWLLTELEAKIGKDVALKGNSRTSLNPRSQLMFTLRWMREYLSYNTLGQLVDLHKTNDGHC